MCKNALHQIRIIRKYIITTLNECRRECLDGLNKNTKKQKLKVFRKKCLRCSQKKMKRIKGTSFLQVITHHM
jgi:hypothetical protein